MIAPLVAAARKDGLRAAGLQTAGAESPRRARACGREEGTANHAALDLVDRSKRGDAGGARRLGRLERSGGRGGVAGTVRNRRSRLPTPVGTHTPARRRGGDFSQGATHLELVENRLHAGSQVLHVALCSADLRQCTRQPPERGGTLLLQRDSDILCRVSTANGVRKCT